jgi:magnesium chelatase subunit I
VLRKVAELCLQLNVDGHRGELTIIRAAKALAALEGRLQTSLHDVRRVAVMSLRHRLRKDALGEVDTGVRIEQAMDKILVR